MSFLAGLTMCLSGMFQSAAIAQGEAPPDLEMSIGAVRLGVTDYDASIALYRDVLGCQVAMDARDDGFVYLLSGEQAIVLTETPELLKTSFERSHVRVGFSTNDLDATVASLKDAGMRFETRPVREVSWVRYAEFYGPSGNPHTIMEFTDPARRPEHAVLGGCSISVPDMDKALAFYGDILGFEESSRAGYPPLISLRVPGGSLTLDHDVKESAATRFGDTAWAGFAFEVSDINEAMAVLRKRGLRFLEDAPTRNGPVYSLHAHDPFGNVIEIIQHIVPEGEGDDEPSDGVGSIADLGWLSGTWIHDTPQGPWIEVWGPATGDAIAGMMQATRDGETWLFELFTVQERDGEIRYWLRHFDPGLVPWASDADGPINMALTEAGENRVVFEDPSRGWPQRLIYERQGDELVARLEGEADNGPRTFELRFRRDGR